ncbi:hypothetical protein Peur_060582 [Populus x canadensis]|jgi:hypothetical protein
MLAGVIRTLNPSRQTSTQGIAIAIAIGNQFDFSEVDSRLPMLVKVYCEKLPGYDHSNKAGAMNASLQASAIISNGSFIYI